MSIPDYQAIMLPLLKILNDGKEHSLNEIKEQITIFFNLSGEDKKALLPSGQQTVFDNRVGWARTYLKKAGLIEYTKRAVFKITSQGLDVLKQNPKEINIKFLERFQKFIEFRELSKKDKSEQTTVELEKTNQQTPEESLEYGYQKIRQDLSFELLSKVKSNSPIFFEKLVVELLVKMGYGGSRKDAGEAIGRSGDEGIDGIINEDKLGLDVIYIQAKRWDSPVGRPEIQKFVGALHGQRAKKGIFITTSKFTKEAEEYVKGIESKIVLIDGEQLAQLMLDYDVGVSKTAVYEIKKIDSDYFVEE